MRGISREIVGAPKVPVVPEKAGACDASRWSFRVFAGVAALVPFVAVFGPQNLPGVLAFAAAGIAVFRREAIWTFLRHHAAAVVAIDLFLLLGFASLFWTIDSGRTLRVAASNLAIATCAFGLCAGARDLNEKECSAILRIACLAFAGAIAMFFIMHFTGLWPLRWLRSVIGQGPPRAAFLKSPSTDLSLLLPVFLGYLARGGSGRAAMRAACVLGMLAAFLLAAWIGGSRAAVGAAAVGALAMAFVSRWGRAAVVSLAITIAAATMGFGVVASHTLGQHWAMRFMPSLGPSVEHRRIIWLFSSHLATTRPLLGYGLGASRAIPDGQRYILLPPEVAQDARYEGYPAQLIPVHPHNLPIEAMLELGSVGAALAALAYVVILQGMARSDTPARWAASAGVLASAFAIQNVSFSAWNPHFLATMAIAAALSWVAGRSAVPAESAAGRLDADVQRLGACARAQDPRPHD